MTRPDLDRWLPECSMRVAHRRDSNAKPDRLWEAARAVRVSDAGMLGRLVRWRIPGVPAGITFDRMFREPPFIVLEEDSDGTLVAGLVGRIWTLRRDYPALGDREEFRGWDAPGTARVVFANWVEPTDFGGGALCSETRVQAIGRQGQVGVALVRPLVSAFHHLIGSEGIAEAVRRAEALPPEPPTSLRRTRRFPNGRQ